MNDGPLSRHAGNQHKNNGGQQESTHEIFLRDASCFSSTVHEEPTEQVGCHRRSCAFQGSFAKDCKAWLAAAARFQILCSGLRLPSHIGSWPAQDPLPPSTPLRQRDFPPGPGSRLLPRAPCAARVSLCCVNCQDGRLILSPVSRCTWLIRFAIPTGEL
jgi:hypothetical protein